MRILFVSDVYFPRINGVSTSIQTFRTELERLGHESVLVCPDYPGPTESETNIVRIPSRYIPLDPEDRGMKWSRVARLDRALAGERFDIAHVQTPFLAHYAGLRYARLAGIPVVATYHTLFEEYLYHYVPFAPKRALQGLARRFSRRQCNALDAVVVPSGPMRDTLAAYGVTAPMHVIPTGLLPDAFQGGNATAFRARHGIAPGRPMLLFVGRVAFEKNIDFLLRMLVHVRRSIPDVLLVVCGAGPAEGRLKRLARDLRIEDNTLFVGYLDRSTELLDCYRAADLFVFASRTETQGLVILESMACGTPVVALAVMGTRDVLREGEGARIAPDDPEGFADFVTRLMRDTSAREELSRRATAYAATWSASATAAHLVQLYAELLARQSGGRSHPQATRLRRLMPSP